MCPPIMMIYQNSNIKLILIPDPVISSSSIEKTALEFEETLGQLFQLLKKSDIPISFLMKYSVIGS